MGNNNPLFPQQQAIVPPTAQAPNQQVNVGQSGTGTKASNTAYFVNTAFLDQTDQQVGIDIMITIGRKNHINKLIIAEMERLTASGDEAGQLRLAQWMLSRLAVTSVKDPNAAPAPVTGSLADFGFGG